MIEPIYIGTFGASLVLCAFIFGQLHYWKDTYLIYDLFNAVGGALLVLYAWQTESWPFFILNGVWTAVSIKDVIVDVRRDYF